MTDRTKPGLGKAKARWRRLGVTCGVLGLAASGVAAANAVPGSTPAAGDDATLQMSYPAKDAIDGRDRPTNDAKRTTDVYHAGDQVEVDCQTTGDVVGGSPMWIYTSTGYYIPDYLVKTGTDGFIPGVRHCDSESAGTGEPATKTFPAKDAIDGRDRPTNDAKRTTDVYHAGDQVEVHCQTTGDEAGGSTIWDYTSTGYYIPDYLITTGTDGFVSDVPRCGEDVPQPEPDPQPEPPRPDGKPRVVALGDSWASGDGSGDYDPATNKRGENKCLRSKHSWQRQVKLPGLGVSKPENGGIDYVQMSCSGATVRQMLGEDPKEDEPWKTNPVQVNTLQGNESHVLMQAGGNDLGFVDIVRDCTLFPDCTKAKSVRNLPAKIDDFTRPGGSLDRAVRAVHGKASRARIVLMGYPKLFGEPSEDHMGCLGVSRNEAAAVDGQVPHFADRVRQRVGDWKRDGINVAFVDPTQAFSGREACTGPNRWVGPLSDISRKKGKAGAFHPTHSGHQELARLAGEVA